MRGSVCSQLVSSIFPPTCSVFDVRFALAPPPSPAVLSGAHGSSEDYSVLSEHCKRLNTSASSPASVNLIKTVTNSEIVPACRIFDSFSSLFDFCFLPR